MCQIIRTKMCQIISKTTCPFGEYSRMLALHPRSASLFWFPLIGLIVLYYVAFSEWIAQNLEPCFRDQ